jgi:hypothetical protein
METGAGNAGGGGASALAAAALRPGERIVGGFRHFPTTPGSPGSWDACKLLPRLNDEEGCWATAAAHRHRPTRALNQTRMPDPRAILENNRSMQASLHDLLSWANQLSEKAGNWPCWRVRD